MKGKTQTKQEASKVFERHGSRKRPSTAQTKPRGAKRAATCTAAAALHPLITSVFVPVVQLDGSAAVTEAACESAPLKRPGVRATSGAAGVNSSIKTFFTQVEVGPGKRAAVETSTCPPASAARQTRAAARGIQKFFVAAGDKRGCDGSVEDVIIID